MKVTIEVTEDDLTSNDPSYLLGQKVWLAYEKEKNKIQVNDWVKVNDSNRIFKVLDLVGGDVRYDATAYWSVDLCTKLSQPLQDMLNKEIKETTRNS